MSLSHTERTIAMPNELIDEIRHWLSIGKLKSVQHAEFTYSYLWLITYLWRYAKYSEEEITLESIKRMLGYNPQEKRINYIIKKNGLLDLEGYTSSDTDYPVSWDLSNGDSLSFSMLSEYDPLSRSYIHKFKSTRYLVKRPVKHMGTEAEEGIFWASSNTHFISGEVFKICMQQRELGCAGFYLFGILTYIRDKSIYYNKSDSFSCSNKTLADLTGWGERKVARITNVLEKFGLIDKEQRIKIKGEVNSYGLHDK